MQVEHALSTAAWRKSSYSSASSNNCVEVADSLPGLLPVRDSKVPAGPVLLFAAPSWAAFVDHLKTQR